MARSCSVENWTTDRKATAITRRGLSVPAKLAMKNTLRPGMTYFDYGCGRGEDVLRLKRLGYQADGWDPAFFPNSPLLDADVVMCAYVLNVIEDLAERDTTLRDVWRLAHLSVVVAVRVERPPDTGVPFSDGVITSRNTFQKYFTNQEAREYIRRVLNANPVQLASGIFVISKIK